MKVRVEIEFDNLANASEREIQYTLMDALAEFQTHRGPSSSAYVDKRYPRTAEHGWLDRDEKVAQVTRRKLVAEEMRNAIRVTLAKE